MKQSKNSFILYFGFALLRFVQTRFPALGDRYM